MAAAFQSVQITFAPTSRRWSNSNVFLNASSIFASMSIVDHFAWFKNNGLDFILERRRTPGAHSAHTCDGWRFAVRFRCSCSSLRLFQLDLPQDERQVLRCDLVFWIRDEMFQVLFFESKLQEDVRS